MDNTTLTIAQKRTRLLKTRNSCNAVLQESLDFDAFENLIKALLS